MWAAKAKLKKHTPLIDNRKMGNRDFLRFVNNIIAGKEKKDIQKDLGIEILPEGSNVTITKGRKCKYAIWHQSIWDCPKGYIDEETIEVFSSQ